MWGLTMTTGSSHYPRGHGFIERQVQIIKKLFNRCDEDSVNHQMALQELRTTLLDSNTPSPAGFLYGRQIKQLCQPSPNLHKTVKWSKNPCNLEKTSGGMMLKPRRDPLSYLPNQFGY